MTLSPEPIGPVEYMVLAFPGNRFTGEITPALDELLEAGLVRIIDLAVVAKDHDGTVSILEMQELSPELAAALEKLTGSVSGLLSEGDLQTVADELAPGNTAAAILFEPPAPDELPAPEDAIPVAGLRSRIGSRTSF